MAYFKPYVDASGLHLPTYQDILEDLKTGMRGIYGSDLYLENDSADGQMLAILALKHYDALLAVQLCYNNRTPLTAIGTGLDSIVKMNGLSRKTPSYSTCIVTIYGAVNTVIPNGAVRDINGNRWLLPSSVTIPVGISSDGTNTIDVSVICTTIGAITALPGDLSIIDTPQKGWISVTNANLAVPGSPVEQDSTLRSRQSVSVARPSVTRLASVVTGLLALGDVARQLVLENDTDSPGTDPNGLGLPAHSLTCIVEGSTSADVAKAIYDNRGVGCFTNGDVSLYVTDPITYADTLISFYRPDYVPIYVAFSIHPLTGYTSATKDSIKQAVADYLNSLQIWELVSIYTGLVGAAASVNANLAQPLFSIRAVTAGRSLIAMSDDDIVMTYREVAEGLVANIAITEV